jgi:pyruvate dehydrogenase E2 component (dihydrolipoamide acetyltransferase)
LLIAEEAIMAAAVVMPRLGWTMEEGSIVEWLKRDGDEVKAGEPLFTIESDKAVNECEALDSGILRIPPDSPPPGVKVPIGAVLAYLVAPGEPVPFAGSGEPVLAASRDSLTLTLSQRERGQDASLTQRPTGSAAPPLPLGEGRGEGIAVQPTISPRARRVATEVGVDWGTLAGSGRTGRIVERDVRAAAEAAPAPPRAARVSPLARRMAEAAGVDPADLAGAQLGDRITSADVQAAAPLSPSPPLPISRSPMSGIRRLIAARLTESARTVAPVTLTTEADATRLVALRDEIKAGLADGEGPVPTYNDLLIRLTAVALTEHPALNASLDGETIVQHAAIHVGLAVDTERGLLVPVVRDADRKSVLQIAAESARLVAAARDGAIAPDDLRGGTFTLTNLGRYEIDAFTPIVNLPECAILGVGRIVARPVVVDEATEAIAVRKLMALSLTFDHRLVDGAPAARFLQRVKRLIERPTLWLVR